MQLPSRRFHTVTWREGANAALSSRLAAIRVHCTSRAAQPAVTPEDEWLLIEWPREEAEPTKYFVSTLPADTPIKELMRLAKLRWRIERDYQELKQELGLGHFEGLAGAVLIATPRCA
ncbi:transposase (fragment) [Paraburkholderia piptadeniae]|uniref:Transposase n=1 Tax=Paraburkholderia piptadeniae TaxID=1701573 RepID=A0A1N7SW42_9BURK